MKTTHKKGFIPQRYNRAGFTLVELLIVIAVIAVLAALAIFSLTRAQRTARDTQVFQDMKTLQTALEFYYTENGTYPVLSEGAVWGNSGEAGLAQELSPFLEEIPESPRADEGEIYTYIVSEKGDTYFLATTLENTEHDALTNDVDGSIGGNGWTSVNSKNELTSNASVDCEDNNGTYCVSNE